MNLAWGGIVLLVLLLPGFLFFVGFYIPERFTRQLAERSALGHLAGTVLVSFVVHSLFFVVDQSLCTTRCVRLDRLVSLITLTQPSTAQLNQIMPSITDHSLAIIGYNLLAASAGLVLGVIAGAGVVFGPFRFLAQHTWVYGLLIEEPDGPGRACRWLVRKAPWTGKLQFIATRVAAAERAVTLAYALTRTQHDGRILMYRGYLKAFGIRSDGTFTYLVLVQSLRLYLRLEEGQPTTTPRDNWHMISSRQPAGLGPPSPYLFIDGQDLANVLFDRERLPNPVSTSELRAVVERVSDESPMHRRTIAHNAPAGANAAN